MRVLVLGGGRFVGYHLASAARSLGWHVAMFNRDSAVPDIPGIDWRRGDRDRDDVRGLADERWDLVLDTWAGNPAAVERSVAVLGNAADRYCYISSTVASTATGGGDHYAARTRAAERCVHQCGERGLVVRLGLVLGPREYCGRLPYWLRNLASEWPVVAPGRPGRPIRYVDVRDAAEAILDLAVRGRVGIRSLTSTPASSATLGALLAASARAVGCSRPITWVPDDVLRRHYTPWTDIPLWIPESGMDFDAYAQEGDVVPDGPGRTGLQTAADTWDWLTSPGAAAAVEERDWLTPARVAAFARHERLRRAPGRLTQRSEPP